MKYAKRILLLMFFLATKYEITYENTTTQGKILTFNELKHFIAYHESANGKYKFNRHNKDKSVDCGLYQINSKHFVYPPGDNEIRKIFDSVFTAFGVSKNLNERIVEAVINDTLNTKLAEILYEKRGIKQWASYEKFKHYLVGYRYRR